MAALNSRPLNSRPLNGRRLVVGAEFAATLENDAAAFNATFGAAVNAEIAATLEDDVAAFSGSVSIAANLAATLEDDVAAFAAALRVDAALGATLEDDAAAFVGSVSIAANLAAMLEDDSAAFAAAVATVATLAATLEDDAPAFWAFYDWSALLDDLEVLRYYACDVTVGAETVRIPISSWQGTLQLDRASYLQAVIPAATDYVDFVLSDGATFTVSEGVRLNSGDTREEVIATAPVQTPVLSEGPTNTTLTISGYTQFESTPGVVRPLQNVRTRVSQNGLRIRADIDLFLRPGQPASYKGIEFDVAYINYYANETDRYMDVGERAL